MKIVIDIPEEDFERCKKRFQMRINIIGDAIANGTPLPKNATNGDMINALFPNAKEITVDGGYPLNYIIEGEWHRNLKDWWDAPYKAESEDKE